MFQPRLLHGVCSHAKNGRRARAALVGRGAIGEIQHNAEFEHCRGEQNLRESPRARDNGMSLILVH
jgi:hypothetical protein